MKLRIIKSEILRHGVLHHSFFILAFLFLGTGVKAQANNSNEGHGSSASEAAADRKMFEVTASSLMLREGPGTQYAIASKLPKGQQVTFLGQDENDPKWYRVSVSSDVSGWVNSDYLKEVSTPAKSDKKTTDAKSCADGFKRPLAKSSEKAAYLENFLPLAIEMSRLTSVDAGAYLAQWAAETNWGQSRTLKLNNNIGGLTFTSRMADPTNTPWGPIHIEKGSSRPAAEGGNYVKFASQRESALFKMYILFYNKAQAQTYKDIRALRAQAEKNGKAMTSKSYFTAIGDSGYADNDSYTKLLENVYGPPNNLNRFDKGCGP